MVHPCFVGAISISQFGKIAVVFNLEMDSGHEVVPNRNIRSNGTPNRPNFARRNEKMLTRPLPGGDG